MKRSKKEEINAILYEYIWEEETEKIENKMMSLAKINDVDAIKSIYLLLYFEYIEKRREKEEQEYLLLNLNKQDKETGATLSILLANNTVKLAYRLLDLLLSTFSLDPTIRDNNNSTVYGYLLAHLADMYRKDNNFHSRHDLEKLIVKLAKKINTLYPFNPEIPCYQDKFGNVLTCLELYDEAKKKNKKYLEKEKKSEGYTSMKKTIKRMKKQAIFVPNKEKTIIQNPQIFIHDKRFQEESRYTEKTLQFIKRHF